MTLVRMKGCSPAKKHGTSQGWFERAFLPYEKCPKVIFVSDGLKKGLKAGLFCGYHYRYYNNIRGYVTFFCALQGEKGLKIDEK